MSRTPPEPASVPESQVRHPSKVQKNLYKQLPPGHGRSPHQLRSIAYPAGHSPAPIPNVPATQSSNSTRARCDQESSGTQPPQPHHRPSSNRPDLVRMAHRDTKHSRKMESSPTPAASPPVEGSPSEAKAIASACRWEISPKDSWITLPHAAPRRSARTPTSLPPALPDCRAPASEPL